MEVKKKKKLVVIIHAFNPSTLESETGRSVERFLCVCA